MTNVRRALVTGATQGIGLAIAQQLAGAGYEIVLHGLEPPAEGEQVSAELAFTAGVRTAYLSGDLSDTSHAQSVWGQGQQALGPIDILVNNAGIQFTSPIEDYPLDRWHAILSVNLTAPFVLMKAALPGMRNRGWGRIVNIASVHGLVASINKAGYLAAKHGLVGVSKGVALEAASAGVTVNCICPGFTDTSLLAPQIRLRAESIGGSYDDGVRDLLREKQPNLTLLSPEHIGQAVVFFCSEAASGVTGVALPIDGGWTAQ